jgi:hypothetical protein
MWYQTKKLYAVTFLMTSDQKVCGRELKSAGIAELIIKRSLIRSCRVRAARPE